MAHIDIKITTQIPHFDTETDRKYALYSIDFPAFENKEIIDNLPYTLKRHLAMAFSQIYDRCESNLKYYMAYYGNTPFSGADTRNLSKENSVCTKSFDRGADLFLALVNKVKLPIYVKPLNEVFNYIEKFTVTELYNSNMYFSLNYARNTMPIRDFSIKYSVERTENTLEILFRFYY